MDENENEQKLERVVAMQRHLEELRELERALDRALEEQEEKRRAQDPAR